mgnify:FL=1
MALDYAAAADGPIAALLGLGSAYRAEIKGEGTWSSWLGNAVFQREEEAQTEPLAEFELTNTAGRYGIDGYIKPKMKADTILARALGDRLALKHEGTLKYSRFDGLIEAKSSALEARG